MSPPGERPPDPALQRRAARPWERPDTEFPAVVPVGTLPFATTGPSAVAVTGVLAYSNGFEFFVTRLLRPDGPGFFVGPGPHPLHPRSSPAAREDFDIGVEFADGGQAFTGGHHPMSYDDEPDRPLLYPGGSSTRGYREDYRWWAWPLPPSGRLDFICRLGAAETRAGMEAHLILDASQQSTQAWPDA
jgi:hypothetical protein